MFGYGLLEIILDECIWHDYHGHEDTRGPL